MQSYKILLLVVVLWGLMLAGCSEDAQSKAAREAADACQRAIAIMQSTGDVEKAQAALSRIQLSQLRERGLAGTVAMVKGGILAEEARKKASGSVVEGSWNPGIAQLAKTEDDAMQALSVRLTQYKRLDAEKQRIQKAIDSARSSLEALKSALTGTDGEGLESQLAIAQAETANLEKEKAQWQQQADEAIDSANKLQAQAQEFFTKSDLARGQEREQLKQKAYDILLGRNGGQSKESLLAKAQASMDQVSFIESRINVAKSRAESLNQEVQRIKQQMPGLEQTASGATLKAGINDIASQQARLMSEINAQLGNMEQAAGRFGNMINEVMGLYDQACQEYSTAAGSRGVSTGAAKLALANCRYRSGLLASVSAASHNNLAIQAEALVKLAPDGYTQKKLKDLASGHSTAAKQLLESAFTALDDACQSYAAAGGLSKQAACAAVANNVFAYLEKLKVAAQIGKQPSKDMLRDELQTLDQKGLECGEEFAASTAGKMLAATMRDAGVPRGEPRPVTSSEDNPPQSPEAAPSPAPIVSEERAAEPNSVQDPNNG